MIKTVAIVSLSAGTLGEDFVRHELELGRARLEAMGLAVKFAPHALMGRAYLAAHPEARAADLLWAFRDRETDLILSAIGGDDTYRLLPWLFDHGELAAAVTDKPFLGFSDTTMNHLMLHKVGLNTFYGQAFLPDVCELGGDMLPYTRRYFEELLATGTIRRVEPSDVWYEERSDFSPAALGTPLAGHPNGGFLLLQGTARFSGPILGGCLDTLFGLFDADAVRDPERRAQLVEGTDMVRYACRSARLPQFVAWGTRDRIVGVKGPAEYVRSARAAGAEVAEVVARGKGHAFGQRYYMADYLAWLDQVLSRAEEKPEQTGVERTR